MSVNLSSSTPAAPAGNVNVTYQTNGSGSVSGYVPQSAVQLPSVNATAQAANIAATSLLATPSGRIYRIAAYVIVSQAATTSSTLPAVVITWTDQDNGQAQTITLTPTSAGNTLTTYQQATCVVNANVAAAIQYSTTGYVSVGATPMQYALHIRIEAL